MNPYEIFALGWFLSDYPEDKSFEEILDMIAEETDDISPIEYYQDFWGSHLADMIRDLSIALERDFLYMGERDA